MYLYEDLEKDLDYITKHTIVSSIGKSVLNRNIYAFKLGHGDYKLFINASHHALEFITSKFVMEFSKLLLENNESFYDYLNMISIYIVPMVNPDGVNYVQLNNIKDFQANMNFVDLNHNYDANFWEYKEIESQRGITSESKSLYSGEKPESEPETKAVADYTRENSFDAVIAYHSQGEEIYYGFMDKVPYQSYEMGTVMAKASGYTLTKPTGTAQYGGFKDWFIDKYNRPGFTIEVGKGKNPLPNTQFNKIFEDNLRLLKKLFIFIAANKT